MKHYIFETKENYINMKQTWATYFNTEARKLNRNEYGNKERKLTVTHFIFYAILRGKDPYTALNNCSAETIDDIIYDISHAHDSSWYSGKWKDFFGITKEEHDKMIDIAYDIFKHKKDFAELKQALAEDLTA